MLNKAYELTFEEEKIYLIVDFSEVPTIGMVREEEEILLTIRYRNVDNPLRFSVEDNDANADTVSSIMDAFLNYCKQD